MPSTADHNTTPGDVLKITDMDDAAFAKEFGLDIGGESQMNTTAAEEPETEQDPEEDAPEASAEDAPEAEETEDAEDAEPEEGDEPEAPKEERKPLTPFTVKVAGAETEEVPDLKLTFKAGRKVQTDVPLDQVVRWAQSGFHAEQVMAERDQLKQEVPKTQQRVDELLQAYEDQKALNARMLEDENFFLHARDQYAAVNTPEHRLARAEEKLRATEQQQQSQRYSAEAQSFFTNDVYPAMKELAEEYPSVTTDELFGRLSIETSHLLRNGVMPREHWPEFKRLLATTVADYAEAQHVRRAGDRVKVTKQTDAKVTKAKEEATKAKRQLARALTPAPKQGNAPPKARAVKTVDDARDSVIDDVIAAIAGG